MLLTMRATITLQHQHKYFRRDVKLAVGHSLVRNTIKHPTPTPRDDTIAVDPKVKLARITQLGLYYPAD